MKKVVKALSLSLLLAAPITLNSPAHAQVIPQDQAWKQACQHFPALQMAEVICVPEGLVADAAQDREWAAYASSKYDYWDAKVLANFWGSEVGATKATMGRKILWGADNKAYLEQMLLDARVKALSQVDNLQLYVDSSFRYDDVAALSKFWGEGDIYQTKLRIEKNLIMGNDEIIYQAIALAKKK